MIGTRWLVLVLGWALSTALAYVIFARATAILVFLVYLPLAALTVSIYDIFQ